MGLENTEPLAQEDSQSEQGQMLDALVQAGKWADIIPGMFPLVPTPTVEFAREQAFDIRTSYIGAQMTQLSEVTDLFTGDSKVQELINGRLTELKNELAEIFIARFPNTKPEQISTPKPTEALLNRDVNAAIQFLVSQGEAEALTIENIPALGYLKPETLIELQIDALLAKLSRYEHWKDVELDGERFGFETLEGGTHKSHLDKLADQLMEETVSQIETLSKEQLSFSKESK